MPLYEAAARRTGPGCGGRRAGGVRGQQPHRGRHRPVRRGRLPRGGPPPVPPHRLPRLRVRGLLRGHAPHPGADRRGHPGRCRSRPRPSAGGRLDGPPDRHRRVLHGRPGHLPGGRPRGAGRRRRLLRGRGGRPDGPSPCRPCWTWCPACARRGSACSATPTPSIPVEDVERLRDELNSTADVDTAIVRYPGAQHGFHCDVRDSYDEAAATDAWRRTLAWLDDHLAPVRARAGSGGRRWPSISWRPARSTGWCRPRGR